MVLYGKGVNQWYCHILLNRADHAKAVTMWSERVLPRMTRINTDERKDISANIKSLKGEFPITL